MTADTYIIIGAGVFGSSTALELAKAGHHVLVLERSQDGHAAPDAASNDINKIIRADYFDEHYRDLGKQAISIWRRCPLLSPFYHETGVMFFARGNSTTAKETVLAGLAGALDNRSASVTLKLPKQGTHLPDKAYLITSKEDVQRSFPSAMQAKLDGWTREIEDGTLQAYFNPRGGWGEANAATRATLDEAQRHGAKVLCNSTVVEFILDASVTPSKVIGVKTRDGMEYRTSGIGQVLLCAGAWANHILRELLPKHSIPTQVPTWPSAQCVVALQLNDDQRRMYANAPVVLDFNTGFYCFEPDKDGIMKIAIHSSGYQHPQPSTSTNTPLQFPSFSAGEVNNASSSSNSISTSSKSEMHIPPNKLTSMLTLLSEIYPDLANATVKYTRVCFYSDSEDENWIIDHVPHLQGLVVASGDSGHAFKFLPVLGSLVCARLGLPSVSRLTPHQDKVFSFQYHQSLLQKTKVNHSRQNAPENVRFRL